MHRLSNALRIMYEIAFVMILQSCEKLFRFRGSDSLQCIVYNDFEFLHVFTCMDLLFSQKFVAWPWNVIELYWSNWIFNLSNALSTITINCFNEFLLHFKIMQQTSVKTVDPYMWIHVRIQNHCKTMHFKLLSDSRKRNNFSHDCKIMTNAISYMIRSAFESLCIQL